MKKIIKLIEIVIIIMLLFSTNVNAYTVNPTDRLTIVFDYKMPYSYEGEEKVNYQRFSYKEGSSPYTLNKDNNIVMTLFTNAESYSDSICEKIIENGYPTKTCQELGVNNTNEAYFATQEAIYAYLEEKDMSKYIAENEEGERILACTKQILEKAKKEEAVFTEIDSEWKIYEEDNNFMYKQYNISLDSKIQSATISLEDESNVKLYSEENQEITNVENNDIVKIIVPKDTSQEFNVKISYTKEGANLYKIYNSSNTDIKYLVSEIKDMQKEKIFNIKYENLTTIIITNYDNETKEKIQGNVFAILNKSQEIVKDNLITNEDGMVQTILEKGEYFLKQIEVKEGYSLAEGMINFNVKDTKNIDLNIYNTKPTIEETVEETTKINVTEENKKILENNVTNVTNIHTTNIEKEIQNQTNETNFENVNYFTNIINFKNVNNVIRENTYKNEIWKDAVSDRILPGENRTMGITENEYNSYINSIKQSSLEIPNLPVAAKQ